MLPLVVAHRYAVDVVEEDVRRHQRGVGEEPGGHAVAVLGLLLELGHAAQLAEGDGALDEPRQLGVLVDVALDEERADVGIEAHRHERPEQLQGQRPELGGIVAHGERVQVDHAVQRVELVLVGDPVTEGAHVVAERHRAGRFDPREDA